VKIAIVATDARENDRRYDLPAPYFGTTVEGVLQGYAHFKQHEFHVVSCTQVTVSSPANLAENISFHSLHVPRFGWLRTGYQGCIRVARQKLRVLRPDIVHGQGTERDCAISAVFSGFKNVVSVHGNMRELARVFHARFGSYAWLAARLEDFTLKRAGGVFCNSAYTEGLVRPRARVTWRVPYALREQFFSLPARGKPLAACVLLNVGVISPRKRQLEILETARALYGQALSFELHFIGSADPKTTYAAAFLDRMREAEQKGYARYLGTKSTPDLIGSFDEASALVHFPSEEAFGLVVAEALARQLTFFGARVGGIADIAAGIPGAELFEPHDWTGLGRAIAQWIRAGHPRPVESAHEIAGRYHPKVIARRHLEIYQGLLSAPE
jgi:glycosyltransferase involved in cell wall biosynthesis